jgi:hypothetical protein
MREGSKPHQANLDTPDKDPAQPGAWTLEQSLGVERSKEGSRS